MNIPTETRGSKACKKKSLELCVFLCCVLAHHISAVVSSLAYKYGIIGKLGDFPSNNVPFVRIMHLWDDRHNREVGEFPRKTCQISLSLKNSWGCSPVGTDSVAQGSLGDWVIQLYQQQGTNKTYWYYSVFLIGKKEPQHQTQTQQSGCGTASHSSTRMCGRLRQRGCVGRSAAFSRVEAVGRPLHSVRCHSLEVVCDNPRLCEGCAVFELGPRLWRYATATGWGISSR